MRYRVFCFALVVATSVGGIASAEEAGEQETAADDSAADDAVAADDTAAADEGDEGDEEDEGDEPRRSWGLGTAAGGGFTSVQVHSLLEPHGSIGATFNFPTLEASFFLLRHFSLEVSFPLADVIVHSINAEAFYFELDAFFAVHVGNRRIKAVISPGVGVELLANLDDFGALPRIPFRIGFELLSSRHRLALRVLARPFLTLGYLGIAGLDDGFTIGGGLMGEIAIMYYHVRD